MMDEAYTHLFNGGMPEDLKSRGASDEQMEKLIDEETYRRWMHDYMRGKR